LEARVSGFAGTCDTGVKIPTTPAAEVASAVTFQTIAKFFQDAGRGGRASCEHRGRERGLMAVEDPKGRPPEAGAEPGPAPFTFAPSRSSPDRGATTRAFVVQLAAGEGVEDGRFSGRVQHLATSDGGNFATPEDLIAIMRRVLERTRRSPES